MSVECYGRVKKLSAGRVREFLYTKEQGRTLFAEEDFAAAHELVVDPDTVLVADGARTGAGGAGLQANAGRSLENVGRKRTAVGVKLNAKIAGLADPGNLLARLEDDDFGKNANVNGALSHWESLQSTV